MFPLSAARPTTSQAKPSINRQYRNMYDDILRPHFFLVPFDYGVLLPFHCDDCVYFIIILSCFASDSRTLQGIERSAAQHERLRELFESGIRRARCADDDNHSTKPAEIRQKIM